MFFNTKKENMIYPPKLKPGDTVGIVAPARKISPQQLEGALEILHRWGLKTLLAKNIYSSKHSYLAGSDEERREDFQSMIDNSKVKAIICARGGYGSTRIVEEIDFTSFEKTPKWIIGFSDVTAFHLLLVSMGYASIHATMPIFFSNDDSKISVESLKKILFSGACAIPWEPNESNRIGHAEGTVVGGNLSLLVDSLTTPSEPDTTNKILIVEEVDEYFYKLDRMFTQLRRTGKLTNLAGLIVGHMTDLKNSDLAFGETVDEIVMHAVRDYKYPVAFSLPSGHKNPNIGWIHGGLAALDVSINKVTLSYQNIYSITE
jgi:muramoyltetrapeptide carboxypeptidase